MRIFVDIDGTLTRDGEKANGKPWYENIDKIRNLIANGNDVTIWSAMGEEYVRLFCDEHNLKPRYMLGKPNIIIDDCPTIRPVDKMTVILPKNLKNWNGEKCW